MPLLRHRVHEESFYEFGVATCYSYAKLLVALSFHGLFF